MQASAADLAVWLSGCTHGLDVSPPTASRKDLMAQSIQNTQGQDSGRTSRTSAIPGMVSPDVVPVGTASTTAGVTDKVTLDATSTKSPSLASLHARLYLAWKGAGTDNLNLMCSPDGGASFGAQYRSRERSPEAPALCAHGDHLLMVWTGDNNDCLNIAHVNRSGNNVTGLSRKVILRDTSPESPAIASLNGRVYLAWTGEGDNRINLMYSSDDGATFGNRFNSGETSPHAPGLAVQDGQLFMTWKGDQNDNLNVAQVEIQGSTIVGLNHKVVLADTSPATPALASMNGRLYLGFTGEGDDALNIETSSNAGGSFGNRFTSEERSTQAPALCAQGDVLYMGWQSDGSDRLNIARGV
jgi:hypothetical protein